MAAPAVKESTETALVLVEENQAVAILQDSEKFDAFYKRAKAWADAHVPDTSTAKGRAEIKSAAFHITKTRTFIEASRKKLTEEARKQVDLVNAAGKKIREQLEGLEEEVRKPLTDWEETEKERLDLCARTMSTLRQAAVVALSDTSEIVFERMARVKEIKIGNTVFQDATENALDEKAHTIEILEAAFERLMQEEKDRAELTRLRAEDEERQRQADERHAESRRKDEEERQRVEYAQSIMQHIRDCGMGLIGGSRYPYVILLRELEEKVVIDDSFGSLKGEAEALRLSTLEKLRAAMKSDREREDAEAKQQEANRIAKAEMDAAKKAQEAAELKHAEALAAEKRRADEAEASQKAEADRLAKEQADRDAREADQKHRGKIMGAAKSAIMTFGVDETTAKAIVLAIKAGEIPNVSIAF